MTWRPTYLVTTLPEAQSVVTRARNDWTFSHPNGQGGCETVDPTKVGRGISAPIVEDNRGKKCLCELVETHYNERTDTLIFVWKPVIPLDDLPQELRDVPDENPNHPYRTHAGE